MAKLRCNGRVVPHYTRDTLSLASELRGRLDRGWFHDAAHPEAERLDSILAKFIAVSEDALDRDHVAKVAKPSTSAAVTAA